MNLSQKIALGAWAWGAGFAGGDQVFGNTLKAEDLKSVFDRAMSQGLNLWDTAAVYGMGASETILGAFVQNYPRENIVLSTKFTPQIAGDSDNPMQTMLDESKARLHTDYIDIYWIHNNFDVERWTPELIPLLKSGQIKHVGVSNHNLNEIKLANSILGEAGFKISAVQNHYSLLHRVSESSGILEYCKENEIVFFAYMVLEQGALSGKYGSNNLFAEGTGRAQAYNGAMVEIDKLINVLKDVAKKYNVSVAQVATAWAISKGTLPIIGVTSAQQVDDAKEASMLTLTADDVSKIEHVADQIDISTQREWETEVL